MKTFRLCSTLFLLFCFSINAWSLPNFEDASVLELNTFTLKIEPSYNRNNVEINAFGNLVYTDDIGADDDNVIIDNLGNLIFSDPFNVNDDLTIIVDGTNYRVSDSSRILVAGAGAVQDGNDVLVAMVSVTGTININTGNGNDNLSVNLDGGDFVDDINFDGGNDIDGVIFSGTGLYDNVSHAFTNASNNSEGTLAITGNAMMSYVGLEDVITDNLNANNRTITFTGNLGGGSLELGNSPSALEYRLGTAIEAWIDFDFPNNTLTIDAGNENFMNVNYFGTSVDANLTIKGNTLSWLDTLNINADIDLGSGNLDLDSKKLNIYQPITTTGNITANVRGKIFIENSIVQSTIGDITMSGGASLPQDIGIHLKGTAEIRTTTGHIELDARGWSFYFWRTIGLQLENSSGVYTQTGNITINGTAKTDDGDTYGVYITDTSSIQSYGGTIIITGQSTTNESDDPNPQVGVALASMATIQNTNNGSIDITGTGAEGDYILFSGHHGVVMYDGNTSITAEDGDVNITGIAPKDRYYDNDGIRINGSITTTGSGDIILEGNRASNLSAAINLKSGSQLVSGGDITMTALAGPIVTPTGVLLQSQCIANNLNINGELAPGHLQGPPGQSPSELLGQIIVDGNLEMGIGDILKLELNDFTNPGIDFDQLKINGTVDISDATLELVDTSGSFPSGDLSIVIIDNDGTDPINGAFNTTVIPGNGKTWYVYSNGGDGNDVVLSSVKTDINIISGNLTYEDFDNLNDNLTIIVDGLNYRISDSGRPLTAGIGATQDGNDVLVAIVSVTGAININTGNGNDNLIVNFDGGNFIDVINFDGGNDIDNVTFLGTGLYDDISHTFTSATNNSEGTAAITGNATMNYIGLDGVITDRLNANERTFTFTGNTGGDSLELNSAPTVLEYRLGTASQAWIDFDFPNDALTIDAGNENFMDINYFGPSVDADLTIKGDPLSWLDTLNINAAIDLGSGNLELDSRKLNIYQSITTTGAITANTRGKIVIENSVIQSTIGDITISGGASLTQDIGIHLKGTTEIRTTSGNITINGTGGASSGKSYGVYLINASTVHSSGGIITITGISNTTFNSNSGGHTGLYMADTTTIENTNSGSINITGTGGASGLRNGNHGVAMLFDTSITAEDGDVNIIAIGRHGISGNDGLRTFGTITTTGTGNISIEGSRNPSVFQPDSAAINLTSQSQLVSGGNITMTSLAGPILTLSGVPSQPQCIANTTIVNGELVPGQSTGQMIVDGNFEMDTGDILKLNLNDFTNPGTNFDQLKINGVVDITDATLELLDASGSFPVGDVNLVIIDNDGTDPVIGTFNNTIIPGNGKTWYVYTNGGDGNDVILSSRKPDVYINSGDLIYDDTNGFSDNLTLIVDGTNYRISDSGRALVAGAGALQDGDDVLVPIASVTGVIDINTGNSNDNLTINFDGGDFVNPINFNGGVGAQDGISLSGTDTFDSVIHNFTGNVSGSIEITGNSIITYSELEQNPQDNLNVNDRVFTTTEGAFIELEDIGVLDNRITITSGLALDYKNPLNSLTVHGNSSSSSTIQIKEFANGFDADLTINGDQDDSINFINNTTNIGGGDLNMTGLTLVVSSNITTTGSITTTIRGRTNINQATIRSNGGNISLSTGTDNTSSTQSSINMTNGHIRATGVGTITLNGTAFSNTSTSTLLNGLYMRLGSTIITDTGDIAITGNGFDNGNTNFRGVRLENSSSIQSNGGNITLIGIGRDILDNSSTGVSLGSGNIQTAGTGTIDISGTGYMGLDLNGSVSTTGSGNVSLQGTSGAIDISAINLGYSNTQIQTGGNLAVTANLGPINTLGGAAAQAQFSATNTTINGLLTPGQSPGQLIVNGNFEMGTGDVLKLELNDFTNPGIDFDQVKVNGIVDITNTTFELTDTSGSFPPEGVSITIIDNDGTDLVIGTFNGLSQGTTITGNGKIWYIYYNQGDGNDVVLSSESTVPYVVVNEGNMIFTGLGSEDDNLTIGVEGTNYRISDSGKPLIAGSGAIQDGNDVLVDIASVTGTININTGDGNDNLNIDFNGGDFPDEINFNGENGTDEMSLLGTVTYNNNVHTIHAAGEGNIRITGNSTINYIGLEQTITDSLDVNERTFTINVSNETTLEPTGGLENQILISDIITIDYNNPNNVLLINGTGPDEGSIQIIGFAVGFDAHFVITRFEDIVRFGTGANENIDIGNGALWVTSKRILFRANVSTNGQIITNSHRETYIAEANVLSNAGEDIIMKAGISAQSGVAFSGIQVFESTIQTTGAGNINLDGAAFSENALSSVKGVVLFETNLISATGDIIISGTGSSTGSNLSTGINMSNLTNIQSSGGNINIVGVAGNSIGEKNIGVSIFDGALIETTSSGTITIEGTGGIGTDSNYGVEIQANSIIRTENGNISVTGTNTDTSGSNQIGLLLDGTINITGLGNMSIAGTSGTVNDPAINFPSTNAQLATGGILHLISNTGAINTPNGVTAQIQFNAHTSITGILAPGQSSGQLSITGNLSMNSGDTLEMEVNDFNTAGSDYDQVVVNGIVNIGGSTIILKDNSGVFNNAETLILIDNDGTDSIIGTFNGLPNGAPIVGNGKTWYIFYNEGDGNDVILSSVPFPNVMVDGSGNLVFSDIYQANDNLTIVVDGTNYRISDSGKAVIAGPGTTQDGNDVLVLITDVTGVININTGGGNDHLNIDFDGGNFVDTINLDGGNQPDAISLSGTNTHNTVTHTFNSIVSGAIDITDNSTITYTQLASSIIDNLDVNDRIFSMNINNQVVMETSGVLDNHIAIVGGDGISLHYKNPLNSLTFNDQGQVDSFMNIKGVASGFDADLIINRADTHVSFRVIDTDIGSGNLNVISDQLDISTNVTTTGSITTSSKNETSISDATVQSNGDISMTAGTDVTSIGESSISMDNGHIQTTGLGNITISGTTFIHYFTNDTLYGIQMEEGSSIVNEAGDIIIIGNGIDNGNADFGGVLIEGSSAIENSTGNISITGTSSTVNDPAINIVSPTAQIQTGGNITVMANLGPINTSNGIAAQTLFTTNYSDGSNSTILNGILSPGQSPGQLIIYGNLTIESDDTLEMEVNNFTTAGSDYDQLKIVDGELYLNNTTLILTDNSPSTTNTETITLIDGWEMITGTFNGLPQGASIAGNGKTWYIYYNQGNFYDVILSTAELSPNVEVIGGNLVFTDPFLVNDDLTIIIEGANYRMSDSGKSLIAGPGAIQDGNDVLVPIASITGAININTGIGWDDLLVDLNGGNFTHTINFDAGDEGGIVRDGMSIVGSGTYANVTHTFISLDEGTVNIPGNQDITYIGLEDSIEDNLEVNDRVFILNVGGNYVLLDTGSLDNIISVFQGPGVRFNNPLNSLTLNGNDPNEIATVAIRRLDSDFDADLIVDKPNDIIQFGLLAEIDTGSGNIDVTSKEFIVNGNITTQGTITIISLERTLVYDGMIASSAGGDIMMTAGTNAPPENGYGMLIHNAEISTTANGDITLIGTAPQNANTIGFKGGVLLFNADVLSDGGDINITGTGSLTGGDNNVGVDIDVDTFIDSNTGDINITGTGGNGSTGNSNFGVLFGGAIRANGFGYITITGVSGTGADFNYGVEVQSDSDILAENGDISIIGTSLDTTGTDQFGINFNGSATTLAGNGNISISGTSGTANASAINLPSAAASLQSGGDLNMTANLGAINTTSGVTGAQFNFIADGNINKIVINGMLAPGQSPGQMIVYGHFELNSGDTLEMEVDDFTTAGLDYDQVVVNNGLLHIEGTTLNLIDNSGPFSEDPETLVLIDNDGTDAVIGTFNGLPNGSSIAGNGKTWYIYYNQGDGNDVVLSSERHNVVSVSPKVYLQGASLNPNTGEESLMRDDLRVAGLIPLVSPYGDGLVADASVFTIEGTNAIVDWVFVELRDENSTTSVVSGQSALLQRDGDIVSLDGVTPLHFNVTPDNYHVAIQHRNHLGIMSIASITLSAPTTVVDFTDGSVITFGSNAQTILGMPIGLQGMWAGDANDDNIVQYSGGIPDTPSVLSYVLNDPANFLNLPTHQTNGYSNTDVDMDGITQYAGSNSELPFILQNVLSYPGNFLGLSTWPIEAQLPASLSRYMERRNAFENAKD